MRTPRSRCDIDYDGRSITSAASVSLAMKYFNSDPLV
jgi:hypothetical protein